MTKSKSKTNRLSPNRKASHKSTPTWLWAILGLVAIAFSGLFLVQQNNAAANTYPQEISVSQAAAKRDAGAFILDVRQPEEWNDYHIPGSTLIPLGELENRASELPQDQEIVVVCRSGNRSAAGRDILSEAGFTQVTSMAGGLNQWKTDGYETVSGPY